MLLFSDVFVPELLTAKERVADDVRRGGVEGREGARGIELGFKSSRRSKSSLHKRHSVSKAS